MHDVASSLFLCRFPDLLIEASFENMIIFKLISNESVKPIFHQNAKYLASGAGVGLCPRRQHFALPDAKYTNMLVYFALADAIFWRYPTPNPRRQPVEYRWQWVFWRWPCTFHVHFMYISCCLCNFFRVGNTENQPTQRQIPVEYGLYTQDRTIFANVLFLL